MRLFKTAIAAAVAISMSGAPVMARSAAPLSVADARAGASMEGAGALSTGEDNLLIGLVLMAIMAAAIIFSNEGESRPPPQSP